MDIEFDPGELAGKVRNLVYDPGQSLENRRQSVVQELEHWRKVSYRSALRRTILEGVNPQDPRLPALIQEMDSLDVVIAILQDAAGDLGAVFDAEGNFHGFRAPEDAGVEEEFEVERVVEEVEPADV